MRTITPALAERIYAIMVATIGAPDPNELPWRQWSFCYSVTTPTLTVKEYVLDSDFGSGTRLVFKEDETPAIVLAPGQETEQRSRIIAEANRRIKAAYSRSRSRRPVHDSSMEALTAFAENDLGLGNEIEIEIARDELANSDMKLVIEPTFMNVHTFEDIFAST